MIKVVHCKKSPHDIYIGRPSIFGNPFIMGEDGDREEVVEKYRQWLKTGNSFGNADATEQKRQAILKSLPVLRDKILGCWCSPKACHGDVLKELVDDF